MDIHVEYNMFVRYQLDSEKLKQLITNRGYSHLSDFAKTHKLNRATLHNYIKGQGGPFPESFYSICEALQVDPISLLSPIQDNKIEGIGKIMPIVRKLCNADKEIAVGLLGSRASGKERKYSDWDLGITRGSKQIGGVEFLRLKRIVDDDVDTLSHEVDFVNLDVAPNWFLRGINYKPIFIAGNSNSWSYFLGAQNGAKKTKQD